MSEPDQSPSGPRPEDGAPPATEHLNIKVTDNNNEVFFKIKRSTNLKKLMDAFCDRQGKMPNTVRFLFDGVRVQASDTPDTVSYTINHQGSTILLCEAGYMTPVEDADCMVAGYARW